MQRPTCAVLADRHAVLAEGVRDLLETTFQTVYIVADASSLRDGAHRLAPNLIVLDLSLAGGDSPGILRTVHELSPNSRLILLTVHDQPDVARLALAAGAHGVVLKRNLGTDFLRAVDAVLRGETWVSADFGSPPFAHYPPANRARRLSE